MMRRALVGITLMLSTGFGTTWALWDGIPDVDRGSPLAAIMPPPSHIEWTQYPVGGLLLGRRSVGDTTQVEYLVIPAGSVLSVPHPAPGADPDSLKEKS